MPLFVTELRINDPDFRNGHPFEGPLLVARDFDHAEELAGTSGITVLGEYAGEIPSNLSRKETRRRLDKSKRSVHVVQTTQRIAGWIVIWFGVEDQRIGNEDAVVPRRRC